MSVLDSIEQRAEHAEVWVAEASGAVAAAVALTSRGSRRARSRLKMSSSFGSSRLILLFRAAGWGAPLFRQVIEHAHSLPTVTARSITSATLY
ncbi:hypothetical protein [Arthrobacter sp. NPDC093139]|uniref:hypothetical protein n=1 Tax=Arthrobacter sp. NPDC093139 TaxID=3363945 RepID=UPI003830576C